MAESTAVIVVDKAGRIIARVVPSEITRFRDVQLQVTEAVGLPPKTRVALICPGDNFVSKVRQLAALGPGQHRAEAVVWKTGGIPLPDGSGWRAGFL
jgi:hypothetical protein